MGFMCVCVWHVSTAVIDLGKRTVCWDVWTVLGDIALITVYNYLHIEQIEKHTLTTNLNTVGG